MQGLLFRKEFIVLNLYIVFIFERSKKKNNKNNTPRLVFEKKRDWLQGNLLGTEPGQIPAALLGIALHILEFF